MSGSSETAVNMVPMHTVILSREVTDPATGKKVTKRVVPQIGKIFAFTAKEVAQIKAMNPERDFLRDPYADVKGTPAVSTAALAKVATPVAPATPGPTPAAKAAAASVAAAPKEGPAQAETEDHGL